MQTIDYDPFDVFDIECSGAKTEQLACEYLPDHCLYRNYTLEITIKLPQNWKEYINLSYLEKLFLYHEIWERIKDQLDVIDDNYYVENHENGFPHVHGYITYKAHYNLVMYEEEHLKSIARSLYIELPKFYWIHFRKYQYFRHIDLFSTNAIHINWKNNLENGWQEYIRKNAL